VFVEKLLAPVKVRMPPPEVEIDADPSTLNNPACCVQVAPFKATEVPLVKVAEELLLTGPETVTAPLRTKPLLKNEPPARPRLPPASVKADVATTVPAPAILAPEYRLQEAARPSV